MNLNSKYFDRIRIRPEREKAKQTKAESVCEWEGCNAPGGYRAPKGRHREGEYHNFCLEHVRAYNKSYNYFAGMPDEDISAFQKSAATGHRPTWAMGNRADDDPSGFAFAEAFADPFGFFGSDAGPTAREQPRKRPIRNHERKSFQVLDLEGDEPAEEIKARFKTLVKQLHPDANGGDRSFEDRLREIINAYHYLKSAGFC